MKKEIIFALVALAIIMGGMILISNSPSITSAAVAGQRKCVGASAALKFIQEKGCERVYESEKCEKQGLVEIQC